MRPRGPGNEDDIIIGNERPCCVPRAFLVVARELRKTLVKYDEISKILGDLSHAQ